MTQLQQSKSLFDGIEKLRRFMKLRVDDVTLIVGVSRPTYYGWRNGRKMQAESYAKALEAVDKLLKVCRNPEWQKMTAQHLTNEKRQEILRQILTGLSAPADTPPT